MPKPALIGPHIGSTPADLKSSRARALPDDLLRDASRRLGIMALLGAALWAIGTIFGHLAAAAGTPGIPVAMIQVSDAIAAACVLASLLLYYYTRRLREEDPQFVLDLGLGYMVFTGLGLGLTMHWGGPPPGYVIVPMITWNGVVVLMFAAIVPNSPKKSVIAGLITVSMNPIVMLIAKARGIWEFGPSINVLLMHYTDYILVGVGGVIAHVVTKLGQQVAKAREMGSYQLGDLLGRGGMGEVYLATHRMLARPAAIKLIRPEMLGGNGEAAQLIVKRFHREARAAASLRSPHTVELYDFGVTDDGTLYFVMELLDGMDLDTLVQKYGPLPASRVIHILSQVCDSLAEAHARGMVHRDIKPANIHVGRVGLRHDFAKVLDFGLVKHVAGVEGEQSLATAAGLTPGTPAYMAPEMAFGEDVDGRADIYALGCVAYFALTGQLVFQGENALQTMMKHVSQSPVPPSQRTGRPIPPALETLVMRCLAKEPKDRPQTAGELANQLGAIAGASWDEKEAARWWSANAPLVTPSLSQLSAEDPVSR